MLVGLLAVFVRRGRVLLGLVVLAHFMMVGGLVMMVRRRLVVRSGLMMMLAGRMLRRFGHGMLLLQVAVIACCKDTTTDREFR
jgi:hypothetical protein